MSTYIINGGVPLRGEVLVRGAKNASYKEMIASLLTTKPVELLNIPQISDIKITSSIAKHLGSVIEPIGEHGLRLQTHDIQDTNIPQGTGEKSRASFLFLGPLLLRKGHIRFPVPGGDKLGSRPLDRLFDCLRQMNCQITEGDNYVDITCDKLIGTEYTFVKPSHTSTEAVLMAAVCADGYTVIKNAAREPEIDDLMELLTKMGASLMRDPKDPSTINIRGVTSLNGATHQVIADRNEAVTFACAALATKGSVDIMRINPKTIATFLEKIEEMGAKVSRGGDEVQVSWTQPLKAINIETEPEPGFMTDWQASFSLLLSQAVGASSLIERIFPYRFHHIEMLKKMGLKSKYFNPKIPNPDTYYHFNPESNRKEYFHGVTVYGPTKLNPANIAIDDLRAGATATLAALIADGQSRIDGTEFIQRGYEKLAERLIALGADIKYLR